jgi:predicted acylesterase/phospholipase RssA
MPATTETKITNLALQGGGAHGAFTWRWTGFLKNRGDGFEALSGHAF